IPIPPRLSTRLKSLALLAVATLLLLLRFLLSVRIVYARRSTYSRLRATGLVPESLRDVQRLLEVYKHPVGLETIVEIAERKLAAFEWQLVMVTNLLLALIALADAVKLLRLDRTIADKYMSASS
ncbi:hypothetical protein AAVH_41633, partial [Aphelenchoides avenae]